MQGHETADEREQTAGEPGAAGSAGSGLTAGPVIAGFGSQSALARAIGARQSTVQHWAKTGQIPSWRRPEIARAAEERGIALGGVSELPVAPAPPAESKTEAAPLRHGRADISTDVTELRDELARLRETIARLTEEVTRLRRDRSGAATASP
jgi:DNA-binding transcriptional regulator YdaS (Cro superfamily)